MAAFDTPWTVSMNDEPSSSASGGLSEDTADRSNPPTVAAFSPTTHNVTAHQRSTILLHHKTPLLLATPPQVTRALAYSHPFLLPLNKVAGLLSWTTGDPWESFLMVAGFWFAVLYGDEMLKYGGPLILVMFIILGMYLRRYSPLSSTGWSSPNKLKKHKRGPSEADVQHRKSLDEILATLQTFTTRCNILMEPMLNLTEFLSTQQTATSATTRPALTALFVRILLASPVWFLLTLPPFYVLTTKRVLLVFGTMMLSWHSRPARISRTILWRSKTMRWLISLVTGLTFLAPSQEHPAKHLSSGDLGGISISALATKHANDREGIRFTFSIFENQRRWIGLGWTHNMIGYERPAWSDEHLNPSEEPVHFRLPEVEGGMAKWRWVEGSEWHPEAPSSDSAPVSDKKGKRIAKNDDENAWIYYDNKWKDGHRGQDSWSRYTRRRKWIRDAELVDVDPTLTPQERPTHSRSPSSIQTDAKASTATLTPSTFDGSSTSGAETKVTSSASAERKHRGWFSKTPSHNMPTSPRPETPSTKDTPIRERVFADPPPPSQPPRPISSKRGGHSHSNSSVSVSGSQESAHSAKSRDDDWRTPTARLREKEAEWGLGDDVSMHIE